MTPDEPTAPPMAAEARMPDRGEVTDHRDGASKPLARCLGEAIGHLVRAVKTPVGGRMIVDQRTETRRHGELTLRRTVIDEIETPSGTSGPGA